MQSNNTGHFITKQGRRWKCSGSTLTNDDNADGKINSGRLFVYSCVKTLININK